MQEIYAVNMIFRDADACNLCREMQTSYETMQCNGKLYNDIPSLFCDFDFDLIFLENID